MAQVRYFEKKLFNSIKDQAINTMNKQHFSNNHTSAQKTTIGVKSRDLGDGQSNRPPIPIHLTGKCL